MAITGRATTNGTENYKRRYPDKTESDFYSFLNDLWISSIGLGTYLGAPTDEVDDNYRHSIRRALTNGINLLDTSANYRFQRSERVIGDVVEEVLQETELERNQVVVATKGGFVAYDSNRPENPLDYIQSNFIEPGVATADDFTNNGHCMTPEYIEYQFHNSLNNLNLETIDVFYIQNPEMQFEHRNHESVYDQLERVFELLEDLVNQGKLSSYGVASWDGLRTAPENNNYLKLESVHERAVRAGGGNSNFDVIQLPFNFGMKEASTLANQPIDEEPLTPLEACRRLDLSVVTSASIMQGKIAGNLPEEIRTHFQEFENDVLRSIQFTRSAPGVITSLVGMSSVEHVDDNLKISHLSPYSEEEFHDRFLEVVDEQ